MTVGEMPVKSGPGTPFCPLFLLTFLFVTNGEGERYKNHNLTKESRTHTGMK